MTNIPVSLRQQMSEVCDLSLPRVVSVLATPERSTHQLVIELTYRAKVAAWLSLQPDLQVFVNPNGSRRDAIAFGLRAVIDL